MAGFIDPNAQRDAINTGLPAPHPNAAILHAVAEGKTVQWRWKNLREEASIWRDYTDQLSVGPLKLDKSVEWRIKPVDKVYYYQMLKSNINRPVVGSMQGYDVDRVLMVMKALQMQAEPTFPQNGLLAFTHTDDGTITKIEYFTMKELRNKGWL